MSSPVSPPATQPSGFSQEHQDYPYQKWGLHARYTWETGIMALPVAAASPGGIAGEGPTPGLRPECAIIQTSAPYGWKVVEFFAERLGKMPDIPKPDPDDDNQAFKTAVIDQESPTIQGDGNVRVFCVKGRYFYLLKKPVWLLDTLAWPQNPCDNFTQATYPPANFKKLV